MERFGQMQLQSLEACACSPPSCLRQLGRESFKVCMSCWPSQKSHPNWHAHFGESGQPLFQSSKLPIGSRGQAPHVSCLWGTVAHTLVKNKMAQKSFNCYFMFSHAACSVWECDLSSPPRWETRAAFNSDKGELDWKQPLSFEHTPCVFYPERSRLKLYAWREPVMGLEEITCLLWKGTNCLYL